MYEKCSSLKFRLNSTCWLMAESYVTAVEHRCGEKENDMIQHKIYDKIKM